MTGTNTVLTEKLWRQNQTNDSTRKPKSNTKQEKQTERKGGTSVWKVLMGSAAMSVITDRQ